MANAAYDSLTVVAEWLNNRNVGIGSSDASAICGCNPYQSALDVYLHKTEGAPATGLLPDDPFMKAGLILEPAVARYYELEFGVGLARPKPRHHPELTWMNATADRVRTDSTGNPTRIVELKTASVYAKGWGDTGTDQIPQMYLIQVQHQMAVFGLDCADVACLIGGNDFRVYPIDRNQAVIDSLIEIESNFWQRLQDRIPPEPDWNHPQTPALINKLYQPLPGKSVELGNDSLADVEAYLSAKQRAKELKDEAKRIDCECDMRKAKIIAAMKDAEIATVGTWDIKRKQIDRAGYTVKPCSYIDFRIKGNA